MRTLRAEKIRTCYKCGGHLSRKTVDVDMEGVVVRQSEAKVCEKCGEKYFEAKTGAFIQGVTRFVKEKKEKLVRPKIT